MNIDIQKIKQGRILVVGDLMLDTYHIGSVKRISPEAPVPVVRVERSYSVLGGAANVARNLIGLGATPIVVGSVGRDNNGAVVEKMFAELDIDVELIYTDAPTITKTRIIGNDQQVVRIDFEQDNMLLSQQTQAQILSAVEKHIEAVDAVIISDYAKGLCSDEVCRAVIAMANEYQKLVVVDPKGISWDKYRGATVVTPNIKELSDVAGRVVKNSDDDVAESARGVLGSYNLQSLLVTRSERGMSYISEAENLVIATEAREVFDVSGAGDTVVATLAASLAAGFSTSDSIFLANKAAGVVVGKMGTSPIFFQELRDQVMVQCSSSKLIDRERLGELMKLLEERKSRIVFTNGCFDILHSGHVTYLERAKSLGDILILGLNSDDSVKRLKGPSRPINDEMARATVIAALSSVDYVVIFDEDTPLNLIKAIKPDVLAKGGDYKIEDIVGREWAKETVTIPFVDGFSTTATINKMSDK